MGKATVFFLSSYTFTLTTSLFSCLAGVLKGYSVLESVGQGSGFVLIAFSLYGICFKAHQVTYTVRYQTLLVSLT